MCRLFAYASIRPRTPAEVMGPSNLAEFTDLSRVHSDGWGAAWLPGAVAKRTVSAEADGEAVERLRSTHPAWEDPAFDRVVNHVRTTAGLVHLRWATPGMDVAVANQHPFLASDSCSSRQVGAPHEAAFAHNGGFAWAPELTEIGRQQWRAARGEVPPCCGTTDSEQYFWLIRAWQTAGLAWPDAVVAAHDAIRRHVGQCSLNAVLVTPGQVIAVRAAAGLRANFIPTALGPGTGLPRDHAEAYYHLWWRRAADEVAVVSSGLPTDGWAEVPDETMLVIDTASLDVAVVPLEYPHRGSNPGPAD